MRAAKCSQAASGDAVTKADPGCARVASIRMEKGQQRAGRFCGAGKKTWLAP